MNRHPNGYYYVQKLSGVRRLEKILAENVKLQRQLKVTRQNNAILRKQKSDLTLANEDLQGRLQEIKADFATGHAELIVMNKKFDELKKNNTEISADLTSTRKENDELMESLQDVDRELAAEIKIRLQYQSEKLELVAKDLTNQKLVLELKTNISKITSELEMCQSENAELVIAHKELEDCEGELKDEIRKNDLLELENSVISKSIQVSKQEALSNQSLYYKRYTKCQDSLEHEIKEKTDLQVSNASNDRMILELKTNLNETHEEISSCEKSLQDYKNRYKLSNASNDRMILGLKINLNETQEEILKCENRLQDYKNRIELICPLWSEWSDCSKTCFGVKTRIDHCQDDNEQIKSCNQEPACLRSGNFFKTAP